MSQKLIALELMRLFISLTATTVSADYWSLLSSLFSLASSLSSSYTPLSSPFPLTYALVAQSLWLWL